MLGEVTELNGRMGLPWFGKSWVAACPLRTRVSREELKDNLVTKWSFTPECQSMVSFGRNIRDRFPRGKKTSKTNKKQM